ncbi:diacylglycerol kinase [candidate division KSB3 bacterium]|jgi:diacylglycerol kinase (ATP)|uniref:Diacylglycerol kinase n=1 Tax=candidate division KSB3 bacterium TaxID=2044937 RepID=A0A9D5JUP4_9BACT|nr:diacylglycerol kinase [candidate division KSB3 bacterium]MBD3324500.1 diacylglycerol kinase [candidate division KSB3 bacterium]
MPKKTSHPGEQSQFSPKRKILIFLSGLRLATFRDVSVAYKVVLSLIILGISFSVREWVNFLLILLATGQMIMAEIFNTTIETLCDYLTTEYDETIKAVKDIAASAATISIIVWAIVMLFELGGIANVFF